MTPEAVRAELDALRAAGTELRARPLAEIHANLARVFDHWSDPESDARRELAAELPNATGLAPATAREGLMRGFAGWDGAAFDALVQRELGRAGDVVAGFDVTAVLLAGEIPMPSLLSMLAPLAVASPVLAKAGSRDPVIAGCVARSVERIAPAVAPALRALPPLRDEASLAVVLEAECIVATGSDATITSIAQRLRPSQRFVPAGHRFSIAVLGEDALSRKQIADTAERLALDVALWDQQGCLSPIACYAVSSDPAACDRLSEALAHALATAEERWPLGRVAPHDAAHVRHERADAEMRAASRAEIDLLADTELRWTVVREADATPRPAPLHRFVRVHPVADAEALLTALRSSAAQLAGVALAGFGSAQPELARALARLGASRVCAPGTLQAPPLDWRHEGRAVLLPLAHVADLEAGEA